MPVDSFRFISPGVFINEIDQSQIDTTTTLGSGPVIFGVAEKGPAMVPTRVTSFSQFVKIFGNPIPGSAANSDLWRQGNYANPTYGAYAAQAYLANGSPLTFVRLVGDQESGGTTAGWNIPKLDGPVGPGATDGDGGTYGLFIAGNGIDGATGSAAEGTLAAIFQVTGSDTTVTLAGTIGYPDSGVSVTSGQGGAGVFVCPATVGTKQEFRVRISGSKEITETTFNFDPKSSRYIRTVFNTNPHLLNEAITPANNQKQYFLAESYEKAVIDTVSQFSDDSSITRSNFSGTVGIVLGLVSGSVYGGDFNQGYATPGTPWIVGQDLSDTTSTFDVNSSVPRLFRVMAREDVEYAQANYKISFSDIKASPNPQFQPYGTFTLLVRHITDTDETPRILEQYNNLDLNPSSPNFIGKRIGDRSFSYDSVNQKWTELGEYPVQSGLIRVEMDPTVANGDQEAALLPFGFRGLPTFTGANLQSGSLDEGKSAILSYAVAASGSTPSPSIIAAGGSGSLPYNTMSDEIRTAEQTIDFGHTLPVPDPSSFQTASFAFPTMPLRAKASDGRLSKNTNAFFGLTTNQAPNTLIFDGSIRDLVRIKPTGVAADNLILGPGFSLDDLVYNNGDAEYSGSDIFLYNNTIVGTANPQTQPNENNIRRGTPQGARRAGTSLTALSSSYAQILTDGFDRFTVPMYGGFDGFDIFEKNPFNNTRALDNSIDTKTTTAYPMFFTVKKAIDSVNDVDQVNIDMAVIPGITDEQTTEYLIAMAEERKDTLAIIDLEGGYTASTEGTASFADRVGSSAQTVLDVEGRNFNSSYGAAYYPWVQINDSRAKARVWVPPSTIALGVMAASAARTELWFAPAGFNRGGLGNGSAGLNVVNVVEKLTATQRDNLYEVNVNPIASFPSEGIVVFGQKTLQATASALDRINVRRLMIYLKKEIRLIANNILFDPNEQITWNRFLNQVNPFLASIKNRFGLSDYRVVLDSSTTTPDMIDRNIMYAKILLKPTRAIEFIALDFVITRSGVEFE